MKFAHMADCHLGAWREEKIKQLNRRAFIGAVDECIKEKVDFILIAGDLFNTALPSVDALREVVVCFKQLKDLNMPVYIIPGSHDFSPSGKTMIDVLEKAGLCINVAKGEDAGDKLRLKFVTDKKTGAKITGMIGKKGMLERSYFEALDRESLEKEEGFKIFMFHTALTELKDKSLEKMDSAPLSLLPKRFNYYASGHVHIRSENLVEEYGPIIYPGPVFPNNFKELEQGMGGFYIYDNGKLRFKQIEVAKIYNIKIDCEFKTPEQIEEEMLSQINVLDFTNTIVMIRLEGTLKQGKPSDISFKEVFTKFYEKNALFVMKNTGKLKSIEFEEIKVAVSNLEELENSIVLENIGQVKIDADEQQLISQLMTALNKEKLDGEITRDFETRLKTELDSLLRLE
ncbi:DNA repair exonuclease [Candidatus Woesearchaeota archaeon]|nr:DNA repair exonuclease [Candidatus Woesearchaeota archaeon]